MDEAMGSRKPPKRLRGWKMDKAKMDEPQEESQEDCDNPLCTRLIELWSQGHLSATQVAEICHLSMLSGCEHPQIVAGAKCGKLAKTDLPHTEIWLQLGAKRSI